MNTFASDPQIRTIVGMMADRGWQSGSRKYVMRAAAINAVITMVEDPAKYGKIAEIATAAEMGERINQVMAYSAENANAENAFIWAQLTRKGASDLITWLGTMPKRSAEVAVADDEHDATFIGKPETAPAAELEAGMYQKDGVIYKVQRAVHGSGKMYAKVANVVAVDENGVPVERDGVAYEVSFTYARGAIAKLTADDRMSYEDAKAFGVLYGTCVRCARTLTDELSIHLGIGPVCGGREFGGEFKALVKDAKKALAS